MKGGGILPALERTGCRVQRNYSWMLQLPPKVTARNTPVAAMAEYQQSALIKSHTAARKWPFLPQEYFFFLSLFISQAPAAHWSLHAGMSHSLASLWRLMKLPWVLLTATIHFQKPKKAKGKTPVTYPPLCVRACVSRCGCLSQDGGWRRECEMYSEWVT